MLQIIPWSDLSNVFRDAIRVCRRLRLEYLWIDSLCIVQDSKDDWDMESSKMCEYYESACITISAASSPNGTFPFLIEREPKWQTQKFELINHDGKSTDVFARRDSGSSVMNHVEEPGPLASRAWVWQETLLSTRVLHFTQSELIWECKSDICAEDGIVPRGLYPIRLPQQLLRCEEDPYNGWHNLISTYSVRQLTYESDRLPALSGVAAKIKSLTQSDYVAGLWMKKMPLDLCWSTDYQISSLSVPLVLPSQYIAPSWAWPSVRGALFFIDDDPKQPFTPLAEVEEVVCKVFGLNPYGQVSYGSLVLRGLVAHILVTCTDPRDCWTYTIGDDPETREPLEPDCALVEAKGSVKRAIKSDTLAPFSVALPCILIGKDKDERENYAGFYVMVLGKLGTDRYCRLGLASLKDDEWFEGAVEETFYIM
ncbi:hypothetical protein MMC28_001591 [Mycoblastus sanguinarius]|nr:hypothetical protein [Mycoblastus sanguinarius]